MNLNNSNIGEEVDNTSTHKLNTSSENIEKQNFDLDNLAEEANKQRLKDKTQAEIMSYFIQNPDENILMSMKISKDPENAYEIIEFQEAKVNDNKFDDLAFSWLFKKWLGLVKLKADGTWEKWEEFSKELVVDRKTGAKWILFVWKKWFKIDEVEFEDITKYETPYETYFAFNKNWTTFIQPIKNNDFNLKILDKDNPSFQLNIGLDNLSSDTFKKAEKDLIFVLEEAKKRWALEDVINEMLSWEDIPEKIREKLKNDLYEMLWNNN